MAAGPDPDAIARYILETYPDTVIARAMGATFFSCDESNWPNFATIVTTDEHDPTPVSDLARRGAFRLNVGVSPETFDRVVETQAEPDYTRTDTLLPHPVYAAQQWLAIVNPSATTFDAVLKPLLAEAHARVAKTSEARRASR